jgi:hypothetical protein
MAIIEDYGAIAKRLRELSPEPANRGQKEIDELEKWRHRAEETARVYVQDRRRGILSVPISRNAIPARAPLPKGD